MLYFFSGKIVVVAVQADSVEQSLFLFIFNNLQQA